MEHIAAVIPHKWKMVAIALGLTMPQVQAIDQHHRGDPRICFADVFDQWQKLSTSHQPVSWTTLVSVLQSQYIGEEALADTIKESFLCN